jgi:hypothetical protein
MMQTKKNAAALGSADVLVLYHLFLLIDTIYCHQEEIQTFTII